MTLKKELRKIELDETILLSKARKKKSSFFEQQIEKYVPEDLESTLKNLFELAFRAVFSEGTKIISATFGKNSPDEAEEAIRKSKISGMVDTGITFVEGTGLGLLGVGVPDIPVFTAMVLRNVYQTASTYGFDYDTKTEQVYVLKIIRAALALGTDAEKYSQDVDEYADMVDFDGFEYKSWFREEMDDAADSLADSMLYLKFVQTIPVVGAIGGFANASIIRKINRYAVLKYHKRMLKKQIRMEED